MPGLADTYREGSTDLLRLGAGVGLVLGGAVTFAFGVLSFVGGVAAAAGLPSGVARQVGLTAALLVQPAALLALRWHLAGTAGAVPLAAGSATSGLAVVLVWATSTNPALVFGTYVVGLLLLVAGVLAGPIDAGSPSSRTGRTVAFRRDEGPTGPTPADGGREEDADLSFPLDDEER